MDKNGKSRHSVWLSDEVWQEVDAFYKLDNCPTRNEFVEKALRQYCGRLHAERTSAYRQAWKNHPCNTSIQAEMEQ